MHVLVSSPDFDNVTRYLHAWSKKLVSENGKRHTVYHIEGKKANKKRVCGILEKKPVDLVIINGHGANNCIAGHDNEILLDASNVGLLSGKVTHALSCSTAKELGPRAVEAGARGFVGYDDKFILITNASRLSNPLRDARAALFLNPAFAAPRALIKGKMPIEAAELARAAFRDSIRAALNSDVQSDNDKCVSFLFWDLSHLKTF